MQYTLLIAVIAVSYLAIAYLPFLQLMFLQKYQTILDTGLAFKDLIHFSLPSALFGALYLFLIYKILKPVLDHERKKNALSSKILTLSSFCVLVGMAASVLTLAFSACYSSGILNFIYQPAPWTAEELNRIAIHEAGHAVVREIELPGSTINAEIIPTTSIAKANNWFSQSLPSGYVMGESSTRLTTKEDIYKKIRIYLAGLAAEKVIFPEEQVYISSSNDLEKVKELVIMLCNNGLIDSPVPWDVLNDHEKNTLYQNIVNRQNEIVMQIIQKHRPELLAVAEQLKAKGSLTGSEIRKIMIE
ncbi:hypothetical protein JOC37_002562 [Desulfohalotomaculum tongense]|uniref:hypothetical protein n=1 Tax=Desulforadius tongensis TaxID=1216062 RepID=UPI0019586F6C|nr:hypothetical protein [Desulforadius tongensis]MBM7856132.1 hypothetical protein [Desulforadius tongensis]